MASIECSNNSCKKMLGYDCKDNLLITASSEFSEDNTEIKFDLKCPRCKRHNFITIK